MPLNQRFSYPCLTVKPVCQTISPHHNLIISLDHIWLVVYLPLWKIWKSVGLIIANIWKNKKYSKPPIRYCGSCIIPPIFVKLEQYPIVSTKPPLYHVVPWNSHWLQFYIPYHIPFYPHIIALCFKPLYNISSHIPYPLNPMAFTITSHVISQWSSIKVDKWSHFTHLHVSKYRVKVSSPIIQWSPHSKKNIWKKRWLVDE